MRQFKLGKLAIIAALFISPISAQATWVQELDHFDYTLIYGRNGSNRKLVDPTQTIKQVTDKTADILAYKKALATLAESEVQKAIAGKATLKGFNFKMVGPLVIRLEGNDKGKIIARIGGMQLDAHANLHAKWTIDADVAISSNPIWLKAEYDPNTGKLSNAVPENLDIRTNVSVSTILDYIPGFTQLITNRVSDHFSRELHDMVYNSLNQKLATTSRDFLGLDEIIPPGTVFDPISGKDMSSKIKEGFANLISGEKIEVALDENQIWYYGFKKSFQMYSLKVTFGDTTSLSFVNYPAYRQAWDDCPNSPLICRDPHEVID
ncbi:hypothetical protein [Parachitinimonas caeni]|uniref:Uncharacterized protein n=1 Tax=Parachitinimonas caeni TaxID=3031301 RepID=A0ABT7DWX1_9NEIS|nr:hypothetical protein [Parachitinimonas caeni]MDK2124566.1 hypothetical protein [Parachitinimonas caeni]